MNKQKNSEQRNGGSSVLKTFGITVAVLLVPTFCMWFLTIIYSRLGPYPPSNHLVLEGEGIGSLLPFYSIITAIFTSGFAVYILNIRHGTHLLTIAITGSVLIVVFNVSIYLQDIGRGYSYPRDPLVIGLSVVVSVISLVSLLIFIRQKWQRRNP